MNMLMYICFTMILILMLFPLVTSKKKEKNPKEFMNSFECGFNKMKNMKNSTSINFLTFMFLFMMLEMEIILIIPFTKEKKSNPLPSAFFVIMLFMMILMIMEWKNNIIKWSK